MNQVVLPKKVESKSGHEVFICIVKCYGFKYNMHDILPAFVNL